MPYGKVIIRELVDFKHLRLAPNHSICLSRRITAFASRAESQDLRLTPNHRICVSRRITGFASHAESQDLRLSLVPRPPPSFPSLAVWKSGRGPGTFPHVSDVTDRANYANVGDM